MIKNAFPAAAELVTKEDLFELAMDETFETRVVTKDEFGKRRMMHGPIEPNELTKMEQAPFALICHNLNTLAPEFYELEEAVNFVPKWEFDDVMSVYTNTDISLGAHIDNYNVFILQGQGKRRWEIQEKPTIAWRQDEDLKVLQEFTPDYAWELLPGDMVYIPPGVAHHGISLEESFSYSIGFKSLETIDTIGQYMAHLKENTESSFYKNPSFNSISASDADQGVLEFLRKEMDQLLSNGSDFQTWLMRKLSASKFPIEPTGEEIPKSYLGISLQRDVHLKYTVFQTEGQWMVCANERSWLLSEEQTRLVLPILDSNPFDSFELDKEQELSIKHVIDELFEDGALFVCED